MEDTTQPLASLEDVMSLILEQPGITVEELEAKTGLSHGTIYNRMARLRQQMRIKTVTRGVKSRYYPFDFVVLDIPALEEPGVVLRIGDNMATARTLTVADLKAFREKPKVESKYASLIGYLDRLNIGEAALFAAKDLQIENARGRIYEYFNKRSEKKFSITNKSEYVIIERIK